MMKKFELSTGNKLRWYGKTLYRVKACVDFTTVLGNEIKIGDLGGYVEKEQNLSHEGKAWILDDAIVCGSVEVCGDAVVCGNAIVCEKTPKLWKFRSLWRCPKLWKFRSLWNRGRA